MYQKDKFSNKAIFLLILKQFCFIMQKFGIKSVRIIPVFHLNYHLIIVIEPCNRMFSMPVTP